MKRTKPNQNGFSAIIVAIFLVVTGVIGFAGVKVLGPDKIANRAENTQATQITPDERKILTQALELKRIDFDLDSKVNSLDDDDDNDGVNDDADLDDDNDGENDDVDDDDDNDEIEDEQDDEDEQEAELSDND